MKHFLLFLLFTFPFVSISFGDLSPVVQAVQGYIMDKKDYPELFGDKAYRVIIENVVVDDFHNDGIKEVFVHSIPHYRQSPTIVIYRVTQDLQVSRVYEGFAPGPLVKNSGDFIDSHTNLLGEGGHGVDLIVGDVPEQPFESIVTTLDSGNMVVYKHFIHMDSRNGLPTAVDLRYLVDPYLKKKTCEDFEFSKIDQVTTGYIKRGEKRLFALVQDEVFLYDLIQFKNNGLIKKSISKIKLKAKPKKLLSSQSGSIYFKNEKGEQFFLENLPLESLQEI